MELTSTKIYQGENYLFFNIWVTLDCNYQCSYCYETEKKHCYMEVAEAQRLVQFILEMCNEKEISVLWLNFHGGEPLLNEKIIKYIVEEVDRQEDIKLYTSMTTNCSIYSNEINKYISELTVSIDGVKESHDRNRKRKTGEGTYETSIVNAMKYLEDRGTVRLRMVVSPNNVNELFVNVKHLYELGFRMIIPGIDYYDNGWNEALIEDLYQQLVKIREFRVKCNTDNFFVGILDEEITEKGKCVVGRDGYQITPEGDLYPCSLIVGQEEYCIGNVFDGIDTIKVKNLNTLFCKVIDTCIDCTNYKYCVSGRCLLLNKQLTNDYLIPSPVVCAVERIKLRLQKLI